MYKCIHFIATRNGRHPIRVLHVSAPIHAKYSMDMSNVFGLELTRR